MAQLNFPLQTQKTFAVINQQQINSEVVGTFDTAAAWGIKVMLGTAALLMLASFLAFILWRGQSD